MRQHRDKVFTVYSTDNRTFRKRIRQLTCDVFNQLIRALHTLKRHHHLETVDVKAHDARLFHIMLLEQLVELQFDFHQIRHTGQIVHMLDTL